MVKEMQRKKIQLILARLLFRSDGDLKSFTDKQKLRVHHHQTNFTKNVKGTSLSEKEKACLS